MTRRNSLSVGPRNFREDPLLILVHVNALPTHGDPRLTVETAVSHACQFRATACAVAYETARLLTNRRLVGSQKRRDEIAVEIFGHDVDPVIDRDFGWRQFHRRKRRGVILGRRSFVRG